MKPAWAAGAITALALLAALLLAFISRAPADVRRAEPGPGATDSSLGADFTDEQVARHGAYREAAYTVYALSVLVEMAALVIFLRGPGARTVEWLQRVPGGWAVRAALFGVIVSIMLGLAAIPLGYIFGSVVQ